MRVLITNVILAGRTGTEVVTLELARGLTRRQHEVVVFTPMMGASAKVLAAEGIAVTDRLENIPFRPEVIHGHHNVALAPALARFPDVPALFVSHDAVGQHSSPLLSPQVARFFAVDEINRERVQREGGARAGKVDLLPNVVDLDRFRPRGPLPAQPRRALLIAKNSAHIAAVRTAAGNASMRLDELGTALGRVVDDLDARLAQYDLVFASARGALEALAVGCAVVVVDGRGLAGLATADKIDAWRRDNFGLRLLTRSPDAAALRAEIARYDARDAAAASARIRAVAGLDAQLTRLEGIYQEIVANWSCANADLRAHSEALSVSFASLLATNPMHDALTRRCAALAAEIAAQKEKSMLEEQRNKLQYDALINETQQMREELRERRKYWGLASIVHAPRDFSRFLRGRRHRQTLSTRAPVADRDASTPLEAIKARLAADAKVELVDFLASGSRLAFFAGEAPEVTVLII